jgi:pSer/pThr/pTyr-binding forkhead associated (FHA) protein
VLSDGKISKLHAKIGVREGRFVILDVMSENGTYVNSQRIQGETPLAENDEVRMGDTVMVLKVLPAEQE